jgi:pimeloyl-ACP methyl ester carboxylesterase
MAEAAAKVGEFVRRNEGHPELPTVLSGLQASGTVTDDEKITAALRDLLPVFFAHYWQREEEFRHFRESVSCTYISSVDEHLAPDIIDDRDILPTLAVPTLVVVGRYDVPCGTRWAQELNTLIPRSRLSVLEDSGHFGHLEQPEAFAAAVRDFVESTPA